MTLLARLVCLGEHGLEKAPGNFAQLRGTSLVPVWPLLVAGSSCQHLHLVITKKMPSQWKASVKPGALPGLSAHLGRVLPSRSCILARPFSRAALSMPLAAPFPAVSSVTRSRDLHTRTASQPRLHSHCLL